MKIIATAALLCALGVAGSYESACTPAQQAEVTLIENWVQADLGLGMSTEAMVLDITKRLAQQAIGTVGLDVYQIVLDAVTLLIDAGVLPPSVLPAANAARAELKMKISMRAPTTVTVTTTDGGK